MAQPGNRTGKAVGDRRQSSGRAPSRVRPDCRSPLQCGNSRPVFEQFDGVSVPSCAPASLSAGQVTASMAARFGDCIGSLVVAVVLWVATGLGGPAVPQGGWVAQRQEAAPFAFDSIGTGTSARVAR